MLKPANLLVVQLLQEHCTIFECIFNAWFYPWPTRKTETDGRVWSAFRSCKILFPRIFKTSNIGRTKCIPIYRLPGSQSRKSPGLGSIAGESRPSALSSCVVSANAYAAYQELRTVTWSSRVQVLLPSVPPAVRTVLCKTCETYVRLRDANRRREGIRGPKF